MIGHGLTETISLTFFFPVLFVVRLSRSRLVQKWFTFSLISFSSFSDWYLQIEEDVTYITRSKVMIVDLSVHTFKQICFPCVHVCAVSPSFKSIPLPHQVWKKNLSRKSTRPCLYIFSLIPHSFPQMCKQVFFCCLFHPGLVGLPRPDSHCSLVTERMEIEITRSPPVRDQKRDCHSSQSCSSKKKTK